MPFIPGFTSFLGLHAALERNVIRQPKNQPAPPAAVSLEGEAICKMAFLAPNGAEREFTFTHEGKTYTTKLHQGTEYERRLELPAFPIQPVTTVPPLLQLGHPPIRTMDELVGDILNYFYGRWEGGHGVPQLHVSPLGAHGNAWHSNRFQWRIGEEPAPPSAEEVAEDAVGVTKTIRAPQVRGAGSIDSIEAHNTYQLDYLVGVRFESTNYFDVGVSLASQGIALREKRWYPAEAQGKDLAGYKPISRGLYIKKTLSADVQPAPMGERDPLEGSTRAGSPLASHPFFARQVGTVRGLPLFLEREEYHVPIPEDWTDAEVRSAAQALIATLELPGFDPAAIELVNRVDTLRYAVDLAWYPDPRKREGEKPVKLGFMTIDSYRSNLPGQGEGPEHLQLEIELFPELRDFARENHVEFEEFFFALESRYGGQVTVVPKYRNP